MAIRVALHHVTQYHYSKPVAMGPQVVRLRPAPHCRTPIESYSLSITPAEHFLNWQQDPHGNFLARLVFPKPTDEFRVTVDLVANLTVINPFDFFIEESSRHLPLVYEAELARDLRPFLERPPLAPVLTSYLREIGTPNGNTIDFLVELNRRLQQDIRYIIRLEPGVQTSEETLIRRSGSCRDSAWLLVEVLRAFGMAARFVSGYLIQLTPDVKPLDGPPGPTSDFTDLHAWTEVFVPGAGWIGLDPTSGLLVGEGHLPLAATPGPQSAAPVSGTHESCEVSFRHEMAIERIHEDPRVTKPYTQEQWEAIDALGQQVDAQLHEQDVRLTMGGEPTFVSIDDMESPEWTVSAVGPTKQHLSAQLIARLRQRFAPGGLLHYGQGKWYPGESLPRWAYACLWRTDGEPIWNNPDLIASVSTQSPASPHSAEAFVTEFAARLGVTDRYLRPAYEDVWHLIEQEHRLPLDVDPLDLDIDLDDPEERQRLARLLERGVQQPVGYVLPLTRAWWQARASWVSGPWPLRSQRLYLIPGDSPLGLRLPLDSLPARWSASGPPVYEADPFAPRQRLPDYLEFRRRARRRSPQELAEVAIETQSRPGASSERELSARTAAERDRGRAPAATADDPSRQLSLGPAVRTALCVEPRDGRLHVFMPPVGSLEEFLELTATIEETAEALDQPVVIEGYLPPPDPRLRVIRVTPDPGVIEVNIHPSRSWGELKSVTTDLYEAARLTRLGTEKFQLDGKHSGTGGGNHVVLGGPTPADSPFLRRPDLLRSLVGYWNNHPSLSYVFSSLFIGPTSQAPRVDEGRRDAIYELEIAFRQIPESGYAPPWLIDRVLRHLLVDLTGNTHRAEFCIDKLFSPDSATGRLGLVELRAFEMPPHARMSLTQQLLVRALVAWFWQRPYREPLVRWGTAIHDRWMLPHFLASDLREVLRDLREADFHFDDAWFAPHLEFRCPLIGEVTYDGVQLELRTAIEPWYVLGEEPGGSGTTRYVDSSVERLQVLVRGFDPARHALTCQRRKLPLVPTGTNLEFVAGVRYRAWQPPNCLHPTIAIHTPLVFDLLDVRHGRSLGGCKYHVDHPGGLNSPAYPINALEAESRRACRFFRFGHTGGTLDAIEDPPNREFPCTLDLRIPRR